MIFQMHWNGIKFSVFLGKKKFPETELLFLKENQIYFLVLLI